MYIDSHCHIHLPDFDHDRDDVFSRAHQAKVAYFMVIGSDHENNKRLLSILKDRKDCYFALGIDPHYANEWNPQIQAWLEKNIQLSRVKAVGEVGLDYMRSEVPQTKQRLVLESQINIALKFNKPVVVHIRNASQDAYDILKKYPALHFVVHCFTGTAEDVDWIIKLGGYISISGIVTFKNAQALRELVPLIPRDRLLWETDAPYLAPGTYRGKRCEPAFITETAKTIADLYQVPLPTLASQVWENTKTIFDCEDISTP